MSSAIVVRQPKIALLSGSIRSGSINSKLIAAAAEVAQRLGADTNIVDLARYDLPVYNQDLEASQGIPTAALDLKAVLNQQDAFIVASPEYNGFPSPLIVNAYTWCSRGDPSGQMYATFTGKSALVLSTSPGAVGGMRCLNPHRQLLINLGVNVMASSVAIGHGFKAFNDQNKVVDERQAAMLESAVHALVLTARDAANREAHCALMAQLAGEYGSINVPKA